MGRPSYPEAKRLLITADSGGSNGAGKRVDLKIVSRELTEGASRAAKQGAVAMLIRSLGTASYRLPHTGAQRYDEKLERIPAAAGLSNFVRITAGAMGTSIATTLWESRAAMHHAHLTEGLVQGQGVFAQTLDSLTATGLTQLQALAQVNRLIDQQAFMLSANDIFYVSAVVFLLLIGARALQGVAAALMVTVGTRCIIG